ncbi:MAG: FtsX-like permease family protein [Zhongshania sp.]|uniref:ABC transporter permease n=1 Tax=Zhongshania sp. TaxID=1971902 RepID=UPI002627CA77|nr:FtsX-like permease family protein [Zhongshania sp.]MDF1693430.1 FtsX-like permease family protein [Zhongshania sp.]
MRLMMLALRNIRRAWRGGELGLLAFSLTLAVSIVTGIAGFSERLSRGMEQQSHHFLAADRVLKTARTVPDSWLLEAQQRGLKTATVASFRSMIYAGEQMQLASIRAVSDGYPLIGQLGVSDAAFGDAQLVEHGPSAGELWLDSRLLALLDLTTGGEAGVGEADFTVSRALISEPDRGNMNEMLAPRAMINLADLAATKVVQPGSLVRYRYLFAGSEAQLADYENWLTPLLEAGQRWEDVRDGQPAMATTLKRAEGYLLLAASLGVALAGAAIALAARRYGQRNSDNVAVMKTLGARRRQILHHYLAQLALLCAAAIVLGGLLGHGLQWALFASLQGLIDIDIPPPVWRPLLVGAITALLCTAVFALPPVWRLSKVAPLRVLRRDTEDSSEGMVASALIGVTGIGGLMWWYSGNIQLSAALLVASIALGLLATVLVLWLVSQARRLSAGRSRGALRLALAAIYRRRFANAFQVASFALALMTLTSLGLLRANLLVDWQMQLTEGAPNHFLINIQPTEIAPLEGFFQEHGLSNAGLYPMVRGRLTHIDQRAIKDIADIDAERGNVNREINLSWAAELPSDNRIEAGTWWTASDLVATERVPVSVEADLAKQLQLSLGSELSFNIGGQSLVAVVSSIRSLDWSSMRPNFYFIFPPDSLRDYAGSYITSFYLPAAEKPLLTDLLRAFPTMTLIEIDALIAQMNTVVGQVSAAIGLVLALVVVCALLVSVANVQASLDSRLQENAILRALGASRQLIANGLLLEFAAVGFLAGLLAALGSNIALYGVQRWVLDMAPVWHGSVFMVVPVLGAMTMAITGWLYCRVVISTPPLQVLARQ